MVQTLFEPCLSSQSRSKTISEFKLQLCDYILSLSLSFFFFFFFFFVIITWSGLLAGISWSVCMSKSQRTFASHSPRRIQFNTYVFDSIPSLWIIIIIIFFFLWEFFTTARADGFPLEFKRQHVSSSLFIIIIILTPGEFRPSVLDDGISVQFEWQQVSSSLQDSSRYSGWSQQYCSWNCLHSFSYLQVLQSFYQTFGDCTKSTNDKGYNCYFHIRLIFFFQFPSKVDVLILLFAFCQFYSVASRDSNVHKSASYLFFIDYCKVCSSGRDLVILFYLKIPEEFGRFIL